MRRSVLCLVVLPLVSAIALLGSPPGSAAERPASRAMGSSLTRLDGPALGPVSPVSPVSEPAPTPSTSADGAFARLPAPAPPERESADIRARIRALPGVNGLYEVKTGEPGWRFFVVRFSQLIDHAHPSAGRFETRVTVLHHSTSLPTTVASYTDVSTRPGWYEPTQIVGGNQIVVEGRFSGVSRPRVGPDLLPTALTLPQAAGDLHSVIATFKRLYPRKWISFGKLSSTYHRAYLPNDVAGSILYGQDRALPGRPTRIPRFFDQVGTFSCRKRILAIQRYVLGDHRVDFMNLLEAKSQQQGLTFEQLGADRAMEYLLLDMTPFVWFYGGVECGSMPATPFSVGQVWRWLEKHYPLSSYHDAAIADIRDAYLDATQAGELAPYETPIRRLLLFPGTDLARAFIPDSYPVKVNTGPATKVNAWAERTAQRTMFVRGAWDPYAAIALACGKNGAARQCSVQTVPEMGGFAQIADFPEQKRYQLAATIRRWAGA